MHPLGDEQIPIVIRLCLRIESWIHRYRPLHGHNILDEMFWNLHNVLIFFSSHDVRTIETLATNNDVCNPNDDEFTIFIWIYAMASTTDL